jgi:hypothetical protein
MMTANSSVLPFKAVAADAELKVEAQLIWGTNDKESPDPKHKRVSEEVKKKLQDLPLKWTNYFEVNRKMLSIPVSGLKKEALSEKCAVEVKNLGKSKVEVCLIGKGEQVVKRTQDLPAGETLVLGGNAPNATAWLVFVKRVE